jgi:multidrug efflux pump subunit AcrA (membrane-fusion protein)
VDLKSGMTANVSIIAAEHKDVLAVPTRAVNYDQGRAYVLVVSADGKTTEERSVQVGLEGSNGLVEILSGLQAGERVQVKSQ